MMILALWYSAWNLCTFHGTQQLWKIWEIYCRRKNFWFICCWF